MKLKNLFWFATGASISYHLVKNRKEIKTEVTSLLWFKKLIGIKDLDRSCWKKELSGRTRPVFFAN